MSSSSAALHHREPTVVVVGGGYAGMQVAKGLDDVAAVTLVDPTEAWFHNVAALRALVDPEWLDRIALPYERLLARGRWVKDRVVDADGTALVLASGERLEPDFVVLATGSSYPFPAKCDATTIEELSARYRGAHDALAAADRVLLVGAGPAGLELAGEIKAGYPDKQVTIVEVAADVLEGPWDPRLRAELRRQLEEMGVVLKLSTPLKALPAQEPGTLGPVEVVTAAGEELHADVWYRCFGVELVSGYLSGSLADARNADGSVAVDGHLRVKGFDRVFALGDVADAGRKMASLANRHAPVVVENIKGLIAGDGELQEYEPPELSIVLPLGPEAGSGQVAGQEGVLGAKAAADIKGRDMLLDHYDVLFDVEPAAAS